jgi:hypothetical protein
MLYISKAVTRTKGDQPGITSDNGNTLPIRVTCLPAGRFVPPNLCNKNKKPLVKDQAAGSNLCNPLNPWNKTIFP